MSISSTRLAAGALLLACALVSAPAHAQAPAITADGDPSIQADTLYRLAVPPHQAPDLPGIALFSDRIASIGPDLRASVTMRRITQQLVPRDSVNPRGVYLAATEPGETLRLNWLKVVRPDGTVLRTISADAVRSSREGKYTEWTADGLRPAAGELLDVSYTVTEAASTPKPAELFTGFWPEGPLRNRLVLDVPASLRLRITERHMPAPRMETTDGGRRTYTWTAAQPVSRLQQTRADRLELYAPDSLDRRPGVIISSEQTWTQVGDAFRASIDRRQYAFDAVAMKTFDEDTYLHLARSRIDTISTIHGWVAREYGAAPGREEFNVVKLGRTPNEMVRDTSDMGSQEERIMLFIAALRAHRIEAWPVLVGEYESVDSLHPARAGLTHLAAWVKTGDPRQPYAYLDPSTPHAYAGSDVPAAQQGHFALVLHDDSVQQVRLPASLPGNNLSILQITGTLATNGAFRGRFRYEARGIPGFELNRNLQQTSDAGTEGRYGHAIVTASYPGTTVDSLRLIGPFMRNPRPYVAAHIGIPSMGTRRGSTYTIPLPWKPITGLDSTAARLTRDRRTMPIDAQKVVGNKANIEQLTITLPDGWKARLPAPTDAESPFGHFRTTYEQKGNVLTATRMLAGKQGVVPPDRARELARWLRQLQAERTESITIDVR